MTGIKDRSSIFESIALLFPYELGDRVSSSNSSEHKNRVRLAGVLKHGRCEEDKRTVIIASYSSSVYMIRRDALKIIDTWLLVWLVSLAR